MKTLTTAEAAQKAGVGELKIKEWMDRGILDYSRVDNSIFIDSRDLQKIQTGFEQAGLHR